MKMRIAILTVIIALLLLDAVALAQSGSGSPPTTLYGVESSTVSGGGYYLASLTWHVDGTASGSGYHLLSPAAPALRGNGCCCTYIPCVWRNF
ncbi:MAG: hypothetical protein MUQ10_18480 [Anaerolineae bacterium]|nr:hypothetical protein [Anaerolineae bacterium]